MVTTFDNTGRRNPNELHDFLIENGCTPIALRHNRVYGDGGLDQEATEIHIEVLEGEQHVLVDLFNQFMAQ